MLLERDSQNPGGVCISHNQDQQGKQIDGSAILSQLQRVLQ